MTKNISGHAGSLLLSRNETGDFSVIFRSTFLLISQRIIKKLKVPATGASGAAFEYPFKTFKVLGALDFSSYCRHTDIAKLYFISTDEIDT